MKLRRNPLWFCPKGWFACTTCVFYERGCTHPDNPVGRKADDDGFEDLRQRVRKILREEESL